MKNVRTALLALSLAAATGIAMAQPAPGPGNGPCGTAGPPCGPGYGPGAGAAPGPGRGPRGPRFGRSNTYGWGLMTPEERLAHRDKMFGLKSLDECNTYLAEHRKLMEERAKGKGLKAPAGPRLDMCARMQQRGFFGATPAK